VFATFGESAYEPGEIASLEIIVGYKGCWFQVTRSCM
jgi:hypothetical protein